MALRSLLSTTAAALLLATSNVIAQNIAPACFPLNQTGCPADEALGTSYAQNYTSTIASSKIWNTTAGDVAWNADGGEFTIHGHGDSVTLQSKFYIFFGRVSATMKASPGRGIVSTMVLLSDVLDEIDWEFLGSETGQGMSNFYGKGNTTYIEGRGLNHTVDNTLEFHNYTFVWTREKIDWMIDDKVVRTLGINDPLTENGLHYPQTPSYVKLGIWAGGDPDNEQGVIDWAGGKTDYTKAPFTMLLQNLEIEDYHKGSSYSYKDKTGAWSSIEVKAGNSSIAEDLKESPSLQARFNALSPQARIGVAVGVCCTALLLIGLMTVCCIRKRRSGRTERIKADAEYEYYLAETNKHQEELRNLSRMQYAEKDTMSPPRVRGQQGWSP